MSHGQGLEGKDLGACASMSARGSLVCFLITLNFFGDPRGRLECERVYSLRVVAGGRGNGDGTSPEREPFAS